MMVQVPIIGEVTEQKLIISFRRCEGGEGEIKFNFDPDIVEVVSPEQKAAANVAEQIIKLFNLNREGEQNAGTSTNIQ